MDRSEYSGSSDQLGGVATRSSLRLLAGTLLGFVVLSRLVVTVVSVVGDFRTLRARHADRPGRARR